jgi:hypothetical protein
MNISESRAPEPILGVGVRQAGKLVTGELNVSPGTPLQMEIFLDKASAPIYGLLVTHMQVTDTNSQEETIIYNGWVGGAWGRPLIGTMGLSTRRANFGAQSSAGAIKKIIQKFRWFF